MTQDNNADASEPGVEEDLDLVLPDGGTFRFAMNEDGQPILKLIGGQGAEHLVATGSEQIDAFYASMEAYCHKALGQLQQSEELRQAETVREIPLSRTVRLRLALTSPHRVPVIMLCDGEEAEEIASGQAAVMQLTDEWLAALQEFRASLLG